MHRITVALLSSALLVAACTSNRTKAPAPNPEARGENTFIDGHWVALANQYGVENLVWSGRELLLFGRERDAVTPSIRVFDPETNTLRTTAVPGPDRMGASTVWTGRELLVIGGRSTGGDRALHDLAYAPATSSWRELASSSLLPRTDAPIAWTGRVAIVVAGFDARPGHGYGTPAAGAGAYDPSADSWRTITEPPDLATGDGLINKAIWTGTEMVVWGEHGATHKALWAAYNPLDDSWRELAPPPVTALGERMAWAVHSNGSVIAVGYLGHAAALDLASGQWQQLSNFVDRKGLIVPQLITVADTVIGVLGELKLLAADHSTWQLGPTAPNAGFGFGPVTRLAWTGRELYAIEVSGSFAKYIPPGTVR